MAKTIELDRAILKTTVSTLNKWASRTNEAAQALWDAGLASREDAAPYVKAWALQRNPLAEGAEWRNSAAEQSYYRALRVFWPSTSAKVHKGSRDKHASVKVNRALVARIVNELSGLTQAEVRATLAAVRDGITFE